MPIYDFACDKGHKFEKRVTIDTTKIVCPICEDRGDPRPAVKQISIPSPAHFSGHGWTPKKLERK